MELHALAIENSTTAHLLDECRNGNREAMQEMIDLSGQSKAPTMDWDGEVLADFGVDELIPFLKKKGIG